MSARGWPIQTNLNRRTARPADSYSSIHSPRLPSAFTLVEMLTVIVIITLIIGLALPVFRSLNGSRSEEGASNQIAAMLGRARAAAIGEQQPRGVVFYTDSSTGQTAMTLVQPEVPSNLPTWIAPAGGYSPPAYPKFTYVQEAPNLYFIAVRDVPAGNATDPNTDTAHAYWFPADMNVVDQVADSNAELLPLGVGAQLINDWGLATNAGGPAQPAPMSDGYVSTGVIMFDAFGRLTSTPVSITQRSVIGLAMNLGGTGSNNFPNWLSGSNKNAPAPANTGVPIYTYSGTSPSYITTGTLYSSFGVVVYDRDAFTAQNYNSTDPTYMPGATTNAYNAGTPSELNEERWLDENETPLLINRYNGTLIRGQ